MRFIFISMILFIACSYVHAIPGKEGAVSGKMYFSNQPFTTSNAGNKNSFASSDYIYGRIELNGQTVKEAFKVGETTSSYPYSYLLYRVTIFHNGRESSPNPLNVCLLREEDKNNRWLNFDVLPDPAKATTVISGVEKFNAGLYAAPLYGRINSNNFPENGEYRVVVKIYSESFDAWGNREDLEKWPKIEDEFTYVFNEKDIPQLIENDKLADAMIQANAFKMNKLPDVFSNPAKVNDANLTAPKIAAILKRDMPQRSVLKFALAPVSGPLWLIEKNDSGFIKQRYLSPYVNIAYKQDGTCYVGYLQLVQQYLGGGRYGLLQVGFTSNSMRKDNAIDCSNVK